MQLDQASELRALVAAASEADSPRGDAPAATPRRGARVMAVTSGKGGVGKTNLAVNLAARLALMKRRVMLLDADLGLANADVLCGLGSGMNLAHVIAGRCTLAEATAEAPGGFRLIRGASGMAQMAALSEFERVRLLKMVRQMVQDYDLILIDTGAGIGPNVLGFLSAADDVLVVTTPEPTAVTDAYGLIKSLVRSDERARVNLLVNMARDPHEARAVQQRIGAVCRRFLGLSIHDAGYVLNDPKVAGAIRYRKLFILDDPQSPAGECLTRLAHRIDRDATEHRDHSFFRRMASWLAG